MKRNAIVLASAAAVAAVAVTAALLARAPVRAADAQAAAAAGQELSGTITVEGSPSLTQITRLIGKKFSEQHPKVRVATVTSHTEHGVQRLVAGKAALASASRPIRDAELATAQRGGIGVVELTVAFSGLAVVVAKSNEFAQDITTEELRLIWEDRSRIRLWSDLRGNWPTEPILLIGQDLDSDTYGFFTETILGKGRRGRRDVASEADTDALIESVAASPYALSYVDLEVFSTRPSSERLRALPVDNGAGAVAPTADTVRSGDYAPLSRPLILYVAKGATARPEVTAFVDFYLANGKQAAAGQGVVPLSDTLYRLEGYRFQRQITGTVY